MWVGVYSFFCESVVSPRQARLACQIAITCQSRSQSDCNHAAARSQARTEWLRGHAAAALIDGSHLDPRAVAQLGEEVVTHAVGLEGVAVRALAPHLMGTWVLRECYVSAT